MQIAPCGVTRSHGRPCGGHRGAGPTRSRPPCASPAGIIVRWRAPTCRPCCRPRARPWSRHRRRTDGRARRSHRRQVYDFLREHAERTGAALLVVTHDVRAERLATRVLTIHDGRLSEETLGGRTSLVVDGRGWVRLPDALRADAGIVGRAVAASADGHINLVGSEPVRHIATTGSTVERRPGATSRRAARCRDRPRQHHDRSCLDGASSGADHVITGRSGSGKTSVLVADPRSQPADAWPGRSRRDLLRVLRPRPRHSPISRASPTTSTWFGQFGSRRPDDGLALLAAMGLAGLADRPAGSALRR